MVVDTWEIWDLHCRGFSVPQISELTGVTRGTVRSVIVAIWADDKESHGKALRNI